MSRRAPGPPVRRSALLVVLALLGLAATPVSPSPAAADPPEPWALGDSGAFFVPVGPARLMDTRPTGTTIDHQGEATLPLGQAERQVQVVGRPGLPQTTASIGAVALNITVTEATGPAFLTAFPTGTDRPLASNLNFTAGQTVPNLVIVKVGSNGAVSLFNSAGLVHVIVDIAGWFPSNASVTPLDPARIMDTRGAGNTTVDHAAEGGQAIGPGTTRNLLVAGRGGVPASGAAAVILNVTATEPTATSFLTVYPKGEQRPNASNLNVTPGRTVPTLVVAKLTDGQVTIYNHAGATHVVVDVLGWIPQGSGFHPLSPRRLLETRTGPGLGTEDDTFEGIGPIAGGATQPLQITGRLGVPATGVRAVVLTVTATAGTASTFVTVHPSGLDRPLSSNLNVLPGQTIANTVVTAVGADGQVSIYNNTGNQHLVVDVAGWIGAGPSATTITTGSTSTCARRGDGQVVCWGQNGSGELGVAGLGRSSPHRVVLDTLFAEITDVDAGGGHACVLRDGQAAHDVDVVCWGRADAGQLGTRGPGDPAPQPAAVVGIAALTGPSADVVEVRAGDDHTCVRTSAGVVGCWGDSDAGQIGDPGAAPGAEPTPRAVVGLPAGGITSIAAGDDFSCAVTAGGRVLCWGSNAHGERGTTPDASVHADPADVGVAGAIRVVAGDDFACALLGTGGVTCWGANDHGQLGRGATSVPQPTPAAVVGLSTTAVLAAGEQTACAVDATSRDVRCWGAGGGRIGDGSTDDRPAPGPVFAVGGGDVATVDVAGTTCALLVDGRTLCAGPNGAGEVGVGTDLPVVVATPRGVLGLA